jgi:hypothetical protein
VRNAGSQAWQLCSLTPLSEYGAACEAGNIPIRILAALQPYDFRQTMAPSSRTWSGELSLINKGRYLHNTSSQEEP